jgi:hypothetical protein
MFITFKICSNAQFVFQTYFFCIKCASILLRIVEYFNIDDLKKKHE